MVKAIEIVHSSAQISSSGYSEGVEKVSVAVRHIVPGQGIFGVSQYSVLSFLSIEMDGMFNVTSFRKMWPPHIYMRAK